MGILWWGLNLACSTTIALTPCVGAVSVHYSLYSIRFLVEGAEETGKYCSYVQTQASCHFRVNVLTITLSRLSDAITLSTTTCLCDLLPARSVQITTIVYYSFREKSTVKYKRWNIALRLVMLYGTRCRQVVNKEGGGLNIHCWLVPGHPKFATCARMYTAFYYSTQQSIYGHKDKNKNI